MTSLAFSSANPDPELELLAVLEALADAADDPEGLLTHRSAFSIEDDLIPRVPFFCSNSTYALTATSWYGFGTELSGSTTAQYFKK